MDARWGDLRTKGFVLVQRFLSDDELAMLRDDYAAMAIGAGSNQNYDVVDMSLPTIMAFEEKLREVSERVRADAEIDADANAGGLYFATRQRDNKGISFPWHQDHESFFMFQEHYHYLNFYIPIVKPDAARSNLCVVPFERLRDAAPRDYPKLVGAGATSFLPKRDVTQVFDDEHGTRYTLPVHLDTLCATPALGAGDLLLMRGDIIHRTQDTETDRVAASFRRVRSTSVVRKARLTAGGPKKRQMMAKNATTYEALLRCFARTNADELTVGRMIALSISEMSDAASIRF